MIDPYLRPYMMRYIRLQHNPEKYGKGLIEDSLVYMRGRTLIMPYYSR